MKDLIIPKVSLFLTTLFWVGWMSYFQNSESLLFFFPIIVFLALYVFSLACILSKKPLMMVLLNIVRYIFEFGGFILWAMYFWEYSKLIAVLPPVLSIIVGILSGIISNSSGKNPKMFFTILTTTIGMSAMLGWATYFFEISII